MKLQIDIEPDFYFSGESEKYHWTIDEILFETDLFMNIITVFLRDSLCD